MKTFEDFMNESNKLDDAIEAGLKKKAKESGKSLAKLRQVFEKGAAAWEASAGGKSTPEAWGYGRVNAYIKGELDEDEY